MNERRTVRTGPQTAVARWLASSIQTPDFAFDDWANGQPAVLRMGRIMDAVRMPQELVYAAIGSNTPAAVSRALAEILRGPVICHPGQWLYALVPPRTAETWRSPHAVVRGSGGWLGVPRPDLTEPSAVSTYWAVPLARTGNLCNPEAVAKLLADGQSCLEGTDS
ncbi:hypothetical protein ACFYYH_05150 [Streptomyces sp. NPDC002018]|uniref:hypothetical protein n=1 Tax=Streptomyces sp. NPDC002018 TaxID=3364629 RepID=UPI0036C27D69